MKKIMIIMVILLSALLVNQRVFAEPAPMVSRHIFVPDQLSEHKSDDKNIGVVTASDLQKDLLFSGIVISPKGKQVILSKAAQHGQIAQKNLFSEGQSIDGMLIKEIGHNYLILSSGDHLLRLALYKGKKNRPVPIPVATQAATPVLTTSTAAANAASNPGQTSGVQSENKTSANNSSASSNSKSSQEKPATPADVTGNGAFGGGGDSPQPQAVQPTNAGSSSNPFLDALKKAAEQGSTSANGTVNPLLGK